MSNFAALTCRPAKSITVRARCKSRMVACRKSLPPSSTSLTSSASTSGWRRSLSNAQPSEDAVVSCPAPSRVSSFIGDVLPRHRGPVLVAAAQQQRQNVGPLFEIRVRFGLVDQGEDDGVELSAERFETSPRAAAAGPKRRLGQGGHSRTQLHPRRNDLPQYVEVFSIGAEH